MEQESKKRNHNDKKDVSLAKTESMEPERKHIKIVDVQGENANKIESLEYSKSMPERVLKLTESDMNVIESVKTSCLDMEKIGEAIQIRLKQRLPIKIPEDYEDSSYYIENGLRKVYPYSYLHQSFAKRRWVGKKLKDVFIQEFREAPEDYIKKRFDSGRILVNGRQVDYEYKLKDNDLICHRNHRHELPVLATPIKIIYQDKHTVVIDKPPSMPIHPCGRYRHNTVQQILAKEHKITGIKIVHRLDRLVSGVLIIGLNSQRAREFEESVKNRNIMKQYVCRVEGEFPLGDPADDDQITVDQPLEQIPGKMGLVVVMQGGKQSLTKFKRLNYNGKTSCVLCKPLSGRMHQIRVHLQYLGFPIVNDNLYNCDAFGPERGKGGRYGGKTYKQLAEDVMKKHSSHIWLVSEAGETIGQQKLDNVETHSSKIVDNPDQYSNNTDEFLSDKEKQETMAALEHYFDDKSWRELEEKYKFEKEKITKDDDCLDCYTSYHDTPLRGQYLYLHAIKYAGAGWCYESEMPNWAKDSWIY